MIGVTLTNLITAEVTNDAHFVSYLIFPLLKQIMKCVANRDLSLYEDVVHISLAVILC